MPAWRKSYSQGPINVRSSLPDDKTGGVETLYSLGFSSAKSGDFAQQGEFCGESSSPSLGGVRGRTSQ